MQSVILTVCCGRVSFFLLRADEHGEGRVRHMEALIWKEKEEQSEDSECGAFSTVMQSSLESTWKKGRKAILVQSRYDKIRLSQPRKLNNYYILFV